MINQTNALQSTTQKYLELFDISNDCLILQDGSVSMVMQSSAINFDLYSEQEQDAAIYAYAALLNSLSFSIEIVIRSVRKDVTSYLDLLKTAEVKAYNPINKKNIRDYRQFVEELVQERNVLDKKFFIIITYTALEAGILSGSTLIPGMGKKNQAPLDKAVIVEKAITNLAPRREHLMHQFARIGLFLRQVKTQELIQLFYTIYNPDGAKGIRVGEAVEYSSPLVNAELPPQDLVRAQTPQFVQPTEPPSVTPVPQSTPPAVATTPVAVTPAVVETPVQAPPPPLPVASPQAAQTVFDSSAASNLKEESFSLQTDLQPPTPPVQPSSDQTVS